MNTQVKYIQQNKAAFFDWLVFAGSFLLGFIFPTLIAFVTSAFFSYMMLGALFLYTAGTWLKHFPLYYRLISSGRRKTVPFAFLLIIGHWCIMAAVISFSFPAMRKIMGMPLPKGTNGADGNLVFAMIVIASWVTWLVYRGKTRLKPGKVLSEQYLFRRELVADIFLILSVTVFSFAFWEKGILAMLSHKSVTQVSDIWFLFMFLAFAYMLCYLPLRYLFLLEDHNQKGTWRRMLLIFAFLLIKALFEILNI